MDITPINKSSKGKILQFDYDFITSLEGECMYCLTDAQVQIILTMVDYIGWPTRWFSSDGTIDNENLLAMQGNLARALMNGCCDEPILETRTNPATGAYEVTRDGVTWTPAEDEGLDPRYTSPQLPPLPDEGSTDNRCRAATNVVGAMNDKIQDFGNQLGTFGTIIALAGGIALAIVGVFTVPPSATILVPIVIALAQAIYELTTEEYLGLFSGAIYDDLQCILYENCGEDGTFTEANVLDILTAIDSTFSGNVALTFSSTIKGWQVPGLNAAARGGSLATGDCSDCEPPTCTTSYSIYCGIGEIISVEDDHIVVECGVSSITGGYGIALSTGNPAYGCYVTDVQTMAGVSFAPLSAWRTMAQSIPACGDGFGNLNVYCNRTHTFVLYGLSDGEQLKIYLSDEPCPP